MNKGFDSSENLGPSARIVPESTTLPAVARGALRLFFIYDVADTIDLAALESVSGEGLARAPLALRPQSSPGHIEFPTPPLVASLPPAQIEGQRVDVRIKIYDYGVLSVRMSVAFAGPFADLNRLGRELRRSGPLAAAARKTLDRALAEIAHALDDPHPPLLEDYVVFEVETFAQPTSRDDLLGPGAAAVASLLAGEDAPLSAQEREEHLRVHFSYFEDDLTIVQWDTALVYDRREGADAVEDILEFANTQLAENRTYDARLDAELDSIYRLDPGKTPRRFGRGANMRAAQLRYLLVDIHELTDRSTNALKIIGDAFYARLYRGAAQRLGLAEWQRQIDGKVQTVGEFYRFFTDQVQNTRSQFLEIVVIVLIAVEIVLGILTIHR